MPRVRHLAREDVPGLIALHRKAFGTASVLEDEALAEHFGEVFLDNPWLRAAEPDSLVYRDGRGDVAGFFGIFRTRWSWRGQPISVGIPSQFMVDQERAGGLAAIELVRRALAGPFDLLLGDGATGLVRQLWINLGGDTLALPSLSWVRPLRPSCHIADVVFSRASRLSALRPLTRALSAIPDGIAARVRPNHFEVPVEGLSSEPFDERLVWEERRALAERFALAPRYSEEEFEWLLAQVRRNRRHGDLRAVVLRRGERPVGWYLYYWERHGVAQVIEVHSTEVNRERVLRHLFRDAWLHGATAVVGRGSHQWQEPLGELWCYFRRDGPWVLAYSRSDAIRLALCSGDAWCSRLDAEYWMRFIGDADGGGSARQPSRLGPETRRDPESV